MENHRKVYYKYCVVPKCENNTKSAPNKVYFLMPREAGLRNKWCKAMRKENVSQLSCLYCCEDHFTIEKDTENYMQYKIMALEQGQKVTLQLKKGVVPYIFDCQKKGMLQTPKSAMKKQRQELAVGALAEAALKEVYLTKSGPTSHLLKSDVDLPQAGSSLPSISGADLLEAGSSAASLPYHVFLTDLSNPTHNIINEHNYVTVTSGPNRREEATDHRVRKGQNTTCNKNIPGARKRTETKVVASEREHENVETPAYLKEFEQSCSPSVDEMSRVVIARVFRFLQSEFHYMKSVIMDCDLTPFVNILRRTSAATGVSEEIVAACVKEDWTEKNQLHKQTQKRGYHKQDRANHPPGVAPHILKKRNQKEAKGN